MNISVAIFLIFLQIGTVEGQLSPEGYAKA